MNRRATEMWEQITQYVDFKDKSVIDLGCGTGDFLFRSLDSGASDVLGIDIDPFTASEARSNCKAAGHVVNISVLDIGKISLDEQYDIGLCFSVLPYLPNPVTTLKWMSENVQTSIIECQYAGDGPGPPNITDDLDMRNFLGMFWEKCDVIGRTHVRIRDARRTIWRCERS